MMQDGGMAVKWKHKGCREIMEELAIIDFMNSIRDNKIILIFLGA